MQQVWPDAEDFSNMGVRPNIPARLDLRLHPRYLSLRLHMLNHTKLTLV